MGTTINKFITALATPVAMFANAMHDGHISSGEWHGIEGALAVAVLVFFVPNRGTKTLP